MRSVSNRGGNASNARWHLLGPRGGNRRGFSSGAGVHVLDDRADLVGPCVGRRRSVCAPGYAVRWSEGPLIDRFEILRSGNGAELLVPWQEAGGSGGGCLWRG